MPVELKDRSVLVIIEGDPRDLRELLRVGITLRTRANMNTGAEIRMHVIAPRDGSADETQSEIAPVELALGNGRIIKPTKGN